MERTKGLEAAHTHTRPAPSLPTDHSTKSRGSRFSSCPTTDDAAPPSTSPCTLASRPSFPYENLRGCVNLCERV